MLEVRHLLNHKRLHALVNIHQQHQRLQAGEQVDECDALGDLGRGKKVS